jgi:hypothetical protein
MYAVFKLNSMMYSYNTLNYVNDVCLHKFSCILVAFNSVSRKSIIFKKLRIIRLENADLILDVLTRAYLVSNVDNSKKFSVKTNS